MNPKIRELKDKQAALADGVRTLLALSETTELTEAQWAKVEQDEKEIDAISAQLIDLEAQDKRRKELLAKLPSDASWSFNPNSKNGVIDLEKGRMAVKESWQDDPKCGYRSTKEFLLDVMQAGKGARPSAQLQYLAAAGGDEHSTVDDGRGGYLIPEGFMMEVKSVPADADPTVGRVTSIPMTSPKVSMPARVDKNHTSSVSGGLTVAYGEETQAGTSSRMQLERVVLDTSPLKGLSYASEELLERSPISFAALLDAGFTQEFAAKRFEMKLRGTGTGQPQGVISADCTVAQAAEGGQSADTINGTNLIKMRSRCWNYGNAIWIANHDTLPQLVACHIALTNGSAPLFVPGNGTDRPDTLLGRPIFFSEFAETLGDKGDIILGDWSQYLWGTYGAEMRRADSIHVRFEYNERTFRFLEYNDGKCWWRSALTPKKGASTLSPFVVLAAR